MFGARYFGNRYFGGRYYGHEGLTSPGVYWGGRYFGRRYFGPEYFGSQADANPFEATVDVGLSGTLGMTFGTITAITTAPFVASVTSGLAGTATAGFDLDVQLVEGEPFIAGMPLALSGALSATIAVGSIELGYLNTNGRYFGGRYFGQRYYGSGYWGTQINFIAEVTAGLSCAVTGTITATPGQILVAAIQNTLSGALSGSLAVGGIDFAAPVEPARGRSVTFYKQKKARARRLALQYWYDLLTEETPSDDTKRVIRAIKAGKPIPEGAKPPAGPKDISAAKLAKEIIPGRAKQVLEVSAIGDLELQKVVENAIRMAQERDDEDVLLLL